MINLEWVVGRRAVVAEPVVGVAEGGRVGERVGQLRAGRGSREGQGDERKLKEAATLR